MASRTYSRNYDRLPSLADDLDAISPYRPLRPGELTDLGEEDDDDRPAIVLDVEPDLSECRACHRPRGKKVARGHVWVGPDGLCDLCRRCGRG